jgi:hypothetical protein
VGPSTAARVLGGSGCRGCCPAPLVSAINCGAASVTVTVAVYTLLGRETQHPTDTW